MKQSGSLDQVGLRLSRQALRVLKERGILVQSAVSLVHQHLAKRYVVRGLESGGAVRTLVCRRHRTNRLPAKPWREIRFQSRFGSSLRGLPSE